VVAPSHFRIGNGVYRNRTIHHQTPEGARLGVQDVNDTGGVIESAVGVAAGGANESRRVAYRKWPSRPIAPALGHSELLR